MYAGSQDDLCDIEKYVAATSGGHSASSRDTQATSSKGGIFRTLRSLISSRTEQTDIDVEKAAPLFGFDPCEPEPTYGTLSSGKIERRSRLSCRDRVSSGCQSLRGWIVDRAHDASASCGSLRASITGKLSTCSEAIQDGAIPLALAAMPYVVCLVP
ncbi:hypothetical protein BD324DRAFT_626978 [Kockovaella imperatae]|uniref:Uncharacterized protein n=1 Tax=Kockovaella imperatae TaxID=4999 RepID=A0A1Y1UFB2_9TREE|nr:hypothetical protein BD324DRAFT_626978 [Kockovaella imperatae]ORX36733.1 hypothetical protein BD324DRAFT_626978 [Kockovaella imperatae]